MYHTAGAWNDGTLNKLKVEPAQFSKLAMYSDTLYYQSKGGQIQSVTRKDKDWTQNAKPMTNQVPLLGSSLAAVPGMVFDQSITCSVESNDGSAAVVTGKKVFALPLHLP